MAGGGGPASAGSSGIDFGGRSASNDWSNSLPKDTWVRLSSGDAKGSSKVQKLALAAEVRGCWQHVGFILVSLLFHPICFASVDFS